ncbi:MAG: radical SAM/Cys-rich domain protein [Deferribacteres bacterium]|nr:radical SAM/Cys-rich domain protein [Deferribacteres bacterium]
MEGGHYPLRAKEISTLVVNLGNRCNLRCSHCFVEASPERTEEMSLETVNKVLDVLRENPEITLLEVMGGAPELSPHFRYIVKSALELGKDVKVPSNLAVYFEPGMEDIPRFLAENQVKILASLPHYTEEVVDRQRGQGTYKKAVAALKMLNELGYGREGTALELDILFNPAGTSLAPDQQMLEKAFKDNLMQMHGITFNHLYALTNIPAGRLGKSLSREEKDAYMRELREKYNPETVKTLMCSYLISVSPEGRLFDCDCAQMLGVPLKNGDLSIDEFDYGMLSRREIATTQQCFTCTVGIGQSCGDVPELEHSVA